MHDDQGDRVTRERRVTGAPKDGEAEGKDVTIVGRTNKQKKTELLGQKDHGRLR